MTSLQTSWKQVDTRAGYYVPVADCRDTFYYNNSTDTKGGSDAVFVQMISTMSTSGAFVSSLISGAGKGVFRDHGKTLVSSGRVFRKVQLLVSTGNVLAKGTDGVAGGSAAGKDGVTPSYLTGYIELPGQSTGSGTGSFTPVARLG